MSHSQMLKNRRKKKKAKKHLAGVAKRAKKLRKQNVKMVSADALKNNSPSRFQRELRNSSTKAAVKRANAAGALGCAMFVTELG